MRTALNGAHATPARRLIRNALQRSADSRTVKLQRAHVHRNGQRSAVRRCRPWHQPHHLGHAQPTALDRTTTRPKSIDAPARLATASVRATPIADRKMVPPRCIQAFNLPVYGDSEQLFYGGPPSFPNFDPSLQALGFLGYSLGFTDFAVQPVIGTYRLYAAVPPAYTTPQNPIPTPGPDGTPTPGPGVLAASAQLTHLTPLPAFAIPSFVADGNGGGSVTLTVPQGATEALAIVRAVGNSGTGICLQAHTFDASTRSSPRRGSADDRAGRQDRAENGHRPKPPTICPSGSYQVYAAANYPMYESSYPNNSANCRSFAAATDKPTSLPPTCSTVPIRTDRAVRIPRRSPLAARAPTFMRLASPRAADRPERPGSGDG